MRPLIPLVLASVMAGCATAPAGPAAPPPSGPLAVDFIVSTNEPFWQAQVEGRRVILTGPEVSRALEVTRNATDADGRHVTARDALGTIEVHARAQPCEDGMSGAAYPWSGELRWVGRGVRGCARPASMPPPPVP